VLEAEGRADEAEDKVSEHIDISRLKMYIHTKTILLKYKNSARSENNFIELLK